MTWLARASAILGGAALIYLALTTAFFALQKPFTLDEFQYAHAAWLVAEGGVPYRDFFDHHFPLAYILLAPAYLVLPDDPGTIGALRLMSVLVFAAFAASLLWLRRDEGRLRALLAPLLALSIPVFAARVVELRPDPMAFALFLGALASLRVERLTPLRRSLVAGLLLAAAVATSQKVLVYGSPLALVWLLDVTVNRKGPQVLSHALGFAGAFVAGMLLFVLALLVSGALPQAYYWCIEWMALHEKWLTGFSWHKYYDPVIERSPWLLPLAAVGLLGRAYLLIRSGRAALHSPELALLLLPASTFLGFWMQAAPFQYSLLPFLGVMALFAADGVGFLTRLVRPAPELAALVVGVALFASQGPRVNDEMKRVRAQQDQALALMGELTAPGDVVYGNAGIAVTRPDVSYFYYTNAFMRTRMAKELQKSIPADIFEREAAAYAHDQRLWTLPEGAWRFVWEHYRPLTQELWLWGKAYRPKKGAKRFESSFLAIKDGLYFVDRHPNDAEGQLLVDDKVVTDEPFFLAKGRHKVEGRGIQRRVHILWLPRNQQRWKPSTLSPAEINSILSKL